MLMLAAFWYILKGCKIVARKRYQRHAFVQIAQEKAGNPKISGRFLVEVTGFEPATFWSRTVAFGMNKNQIKQIVLISYCFFQWFGVGLHQVLSPSKRGIIDLFLCKQLYSYLFAIAFKCFFMPSTTCSGPTIVT